MFLDCISFLPFAIRKLPEALGMTGSKSWYANYFNTQTNLDYIGKIPVIAYYGGDEMRASERKEFLVWYEGQRFEVYEKKRVLETYSV